MSEAPRFDPERLMRFPVPEVRQEWSRRDTSLYALSLGIGHSPMDPARLRYVRQTDGMAVLPSMATVIAHPGFWLAHPDSGVDPSCALHGEQAISVHRPLRSEGRFLSRTRNTGLVDKGEGRDAVLHTRTDILDPDTDELIVTLSRTTILRKCGGFGGDRGVPSFSPAAVSGNAFRAGTLDSATAPDQALLYALNGDTNPLHTDPAAAARLGFPKPILHGLCTFGIVTFAVSHLALGDRPETLREISVRFAGPVYPGEMVRVDFDAGGTFTAAVPERDVTVITNGRVSGLSDRNP